MPAQPPPPQASIDLLNQAIQTLKDGDVNAAGGLYRKACEAAKGHAGIPMVMADSLMARGYIKHALSARLTAYTWAPFEPNVRIALTRALAPMRFDKASQTVHDALVSLMDSADIGAQELSQPTLSLLKLEPALHSLIAVRGRPERAARLVNSPSTKKLLEGRLWVTLLTRSIVADPDAEAVFRTLRQVFLEQVKAGRAPTEEEALRTWAVLALQAEMTAWAWPVTAAEEEQVAAIAEQVSKAPPLSWTPEVVALALYGPLLDSLRHLEAPMTGGPLAGLHHRLIGERQRLAHLEAAIPSVAAAGSPTSERVRAQYDANPYPRWRTATLQPAAPLAEVIGNLLPWYPPEERERLAAVERPQILVAGCGTGQHAIKVAHRYENGHVLAVDLSRRALAFAAMRAQDYSCANLSFAEADLLALADSALVLPEPRGPYDLIECSGVLHHLEDPAAGLRALAGRLKPSGLMKLGLYSRRGRSAVAAAREALGSVPEVLDPAALRAARERLLALPPEHPAHGITEVLDFYDLNGVRDLLFHVQERDYDLNEVAALLEDCGLAFLGFELPDPITLRAFAKDNPDRAAIADLSAWARFEAAQPTSFAVMYQFWVAPKR